MDLQSIGFNIKRIRQSKNIAQWKLAKMIGVTQASINRIENGKQNYTMKIITKIANALKVPLYEIFAEEPLVPRSYALRIEEKARHEVREDVSYVQVKLFEDPVSLGPGYELTDMIPEDFAPIMKKMLPKGYTSDPDRIVSFRTSGISMKPTINDGSIVWIDRMDITPKEGEVYAFLLTDDTVTIKRLIKISNGSMIIDGDNKDSEDRKSDDLKNFPMIVQPYEATSAIRGRVIWVLNRFI